MRSGIFAALLWPALATAAGHPDLSGNWEGVTGSTSAVSYPTAAAPGGSINAGMMSPELAAVALKQMQETGAGKAASALRGMQSQPQFRTPELARRAEELWQNGSGSDAVVACGQPGLPRIGAPLKIVQTAHELVFLYADVAGMAWRIVPTDGRGFRERLDPSYYGDSVGHWEGDTLTWQVRVEDPKVLAAPWEKRPVEMHRTDQQVEEPYRCVVTPTSGGHHEQRIP